MKASEIIMYVDNVAIGSESKEELQKTLDNLAKWADRNNLEINIGKTILLNIMFLHRWWKIKVN